jgi:hypothetical protein
MRPVKREARAAMQDGTVLYEAVKSVPRRATLSRLGVCTTGWPAMLRQSPRSGSATMRSILGRLMA